MAGLLSLILTVTTLLGSIPVYAAEQVYTNALKKPARLLKPGMTAQRIPAFQKAS